MLRGLTCTALLAVALLAAGCTSSGSSTAGSTAPVQPSTPVSSPAPTSQVPTTSQAAPATPATPSVQALSKFEGDPGVQALRAWAAALAKALTAGHYTDAATNALMTAAFAKTLKSVDGDEVSRFYPGPVPFTPISVGDITSTSRTVKLCLLAGGYSEHRKTHKKFTKRSVVPVLSSTTLEHGKWLVASFDSATFSCKGVPIPEPSS